MGLTVLRKAGFCASDLSNPRLWECRKQGMVLVKGYMQHIVYSGSCPTFECQISPLKAFLFRMQCCAF